MGEKRGAGMSTQEMESMNMAVDAVDDEMNLMNNIKKNNEKYEIIFEKSKIHVMMGVKKRNAARERGISE